MTNTRLEYLYRDTANYKEHGTFTFAGDAAPEQIQTFLACLPTRGSGNPSFVPAQVGLPDLSQDMPGHYDDDHGWHEIIAIASTHASPDTSETFEAFLACAHTIITGELWDDDPRIPWDRYPIYSHTAPPGEAVEADRWVARPGGIWIATHHPHDHPGEHNDPAEHGDAGDLGGEPWPAVRAIADIPRVGELRYRLRTGRLSEGGSGLRDVVDETPGQIILTAGQIQAWTGRALGPRQLEQLEAAIGVSSIPEALAAIVDGIPDEVADPKNLTDRDDDERGADLGPEGLSDNHNHLEREQSWHV